MIEFLKSGTIGNISGDQTLYLRDYNTVTDEELAPIVDRWKSLGLLACLDESLVNRIGFAYEQAAVYLIDNYDNDDDDGLLPTVIFPCIRRIITRLNDPNTYDFQKVWKYITQFNLREIVEECARTAYVSYLIDAEAEIVAILCDAVSKKFNDPLIDFGETFMKTLEEQRERWEKTRQEFIAKESSRRYPFNMVVEKGKTLSAQSVYCEIHYRVEDVDPLAIDKTIEKWEGTKLLDGIENIDIKKKVALVYEQISTALLFKYDNYDFYDGMFTTARKLIESSLGNNFDTDTFIYNYMKINRDNCVFKRVKDGLGENASDADSIGIGVQCMVALFTEYYNIQENCDAVFSNWEELVDAKLKKITESVSRN